MGERRRESSRRALARVRLPNANRETLMPCPACDGSGKRLTEKLDGTYSMKHCSWCDGVASVDHAIFALFTRWLGIYNHNRLHGRCTKKSG